MPLWAPYTWTTGEILTASHMNQQVRDNMTWLHDRPTDETGVDETLPLTLANTDQWYTISTLTLDEGQWMIWFHCGGDALDVGDRFQMRLRNTTEPDTLEQFEMGTWTRSGGPTYRWHGLIHTLTGTFLVETEVSGDALCIETQNAVVQDAQLVALRVDFEG